MNGKPIMDRILLRAIKQEQKGSIVIAEKYQQSDKYEVVAVGDFVVVSGNRLPVTEFVNVGDVVLVSEYNIEPVEIDGQKLFLTRVQDVRYRENKRVAHRPITATSVPA